jgi:hypothetical protein
VIYDESNENAHIILGSVIDPNIGDKVIVSVIATGFETPVAYAKKVDSQEIEQPVFFSAEKNASIHISQEKSVPFQKIDELHRNEYLQRAGEGILELVEDESHKKSVHSATQQYNEKLSQEIDLLDIPAFLRRPKPDDSQKNQIE